MVVGRLRGRRQEGDVGRWRVVVVNITNMIPRWLYGRRKINALLNGWIYSYRCCYIQLQSRKPPLLRGETRYRLLEFFATEKRRPVPIEKSEKEKVFLDGEWGGRLKRYNKL